MTATAIAGTRPTALLLFPAAIMMFRSASALRPLKAQVSFLSSSPAHAAPSSSSRRLFRDSRSLAVRRQRLHPPSRSLSTSASLSPAPSSSLSPEYLVEAAKLFVERKNAAGSGKSTLDGVFDMCSPSVDLYGLKGGDVRPGFEAFFRKHRGLHHEILNDPSVVGPGVVQYPFVKRWFDGDEGGSSGGGEKEWRSIDPAKTRDKVERLRFDSEGMLEKASVVGFGDPLD